MFNEAFTPKEVQELLIKMRVNPERKDTQYPAGEEWKKYIHTTTGKNGAAKGKKLTYVVLELDGIAKSGSETRSGKRMLAATVGNHVRTVFREYDQKLFNLILDVLKSEGGINNETRELDAVAEGRIYTEPCGFEYEAVIEGHKRKRKSVKVICLFDENDKAGDMIASAIDEAKKTKISSPTDDKAAEEFRTGNEHGNHTDADIPETTAEETEEDL